MRIGVPTRILLVGRPSPLIEGLRDLLQLAGYQVALASDWVQAAPQLAAAPPGLAIIDPSSGQTDKPSPSQAVPELPALANVPLLFVALGLDEPLDGLRRRIGINGDGRVHFYTHNLLGVEGLLDQVESILHSA